MRKIGMRRVSSLRAAEGVELDPVVVNLISESLLLEGLREPLVVTPAGHVIHGAHRLAAARRAGLAEIECVIEHPSPTRVIHDGKVDAENWARRHLSPVEANKIRMRLLDNREAYRSSLAKAIKSEAEEKKPNDLPESNARATIAAPKLAGRKKSEKRAATEAVAKATGTTPDAIREATRRAAKKAAKEKTPGVVAEVAPVDSNGKDIPAHLVARWNEYQALYDRLAALARSIHVEFGKFRLDDGSYPGGLAHPQGVARSFSGAVRVSRPFALCAWCGGNGKCKSCGDFGFVAKGDRTEEQREALS